MVDVGWDRMGGDAPMHRTEVAASLAGEKGGGAGLALSPSLAHLCRTVLYSVLWC